MQNAEKICYILKNEYKNAQCSLNFKNDFQLLVSARLSAQCKDSRVNMVTPVLFRKFPDVLSLAKAEVSEIEEIIKPCGLFKVKSRNLKDMCSVLLKKFDSKIPFGLENLQQLPGIGRKTANLIMSEIFGQPSIIVDTHVSRVSRRIGFHNETDPLKIEAILQKNIPVGDWSTVSHCFVFHGREICRARSPKCAKCCLNKYCEFGGYCEKKQNQTNQRS